MTLGTDPVASPRWADFPTAEFHFRVERAQRLMRAQGIDVLMLSAQENVEYFAGFLTGHWASKTFSAAVLLLHAEKPPALVVPDFFSGTARDSSWIEHHVYFTEPHAQPRNAGKALGDALVELAGDRAVVGIESGQNLIAHLNLTDYHAVRDRLTGFEWVSAESVVWGCRMLKSAVEIERLRAITRITERAIAGARSEFHVGTTEKEIAAAIVTRGFEEGADGIAFTNIRAGLDRYRSADSLPMDRPIQVGEMLILDIGLKLKGYNSDVAYCAHVGRPPQKHVDIWRNIVKAQEKTIAMMRPGATAREVYATCNQVLADYGFGNLIDMVGHGIGKDVHEPPILAPYDDHVLEPGMVFALEPWVYDVNGIGIFCLEEHIAITDGEPDRLSQLERDDLWWIPE